jgi:hypothetical protein
MKVAVRKAASGAMPRRERMLSERTRAPALRDIYPDLGQLAIELVFDDRLAPTPTPSPQLRTLYPAAPAFFRFPCPCTDCDGDFDLTAPVAALVEKSGKRKPVSGSGTGTLTCAGVRLRDRAENRSCSMEATYKLVALPPSSE